MSVQQCGLCLQYDDDCDCVLTTAVKFDAACEEFRRVRGVLGAIEFPTPMLDLLFLNAKTGALPSPTTVCGDIGGDSADGGGL